MDNIKNKLIELERKLSSKPSKTRFENMDVTSSVVQTFSGDVTLKTATVDGVSLKTTETSFIEDLNTDLIKSKLRIAKIGEFNGTYSEQYLSSRCSISDDGNTIIYSDRFSPEGEDDNGIVYVKRNTNGTWSDLGTPFVGANTLDRLGSFVSITGDGNRIAIGAYGTNSDQGQVKVYDWNGLSWDQVGQTLDGTQGGGRLGWSGNITNDGKYLFVGSLFHSSNGLYRNGRASVFYFNGSTWEQYGNVIYGTQNFELFAYNGKLSDNAKTLVLGNVLNDNNQVNNGKVVVYEYENEKWINKKEITGKNYSTDSDPEIGGSIDISPDGKTFVVGSPYYDSLNNNTIGLVQVFRKSGHDYLEIGHFEKDSESNYLGFSVGLAKNGNFLIYSELASSEQWRGNVYFYEYHNNEWVQVLDKLSGITGTELGIRISLSRDGNSFLVTADSTDTGGLTNNGTVYAYRIKEYSLEMSLRPYNPDTGVVYFDSVSNRMYIYNGTSWVYKIMT